jgi:hypothetical protein
VLDLNNLPDKSATPNGVARENVGSSLDFLPDTNSDTLRSLYRQQKVNPDEYAKARSLSKATGLPTPTVQSNPAQATELVNEPDWNTVEQLSPKAAAALVNNTELFNLAKDDTANLAQWERGLDLSKRKDQELAVQKMPGKQDDTVGAAFKRGVTALGVFGEASAVKIDELLTAVGTMFLPEPKKGPMGLAQQGPIDASNQTAKSSLTDVAKAYSALPRDKRLEVAGKIFEQAYDNDKSISGAVDALGYIVRNPDAAFNFMVEMGVQAAPFAPVGGAIGGAVGGSVASRIASQKFAEYVSGAATMAGVNFTANYGPTLAGEIAQKIAEGLPFEDAWEYANTKALTEGGVNAAFAFVPVPGGGKGSSFFSKVGNIAGEVVKQGVAGATGAAAAAASVGETASPAELFLEAVGEGFGAPTDVAWAAVTSGARKLTSDSTKVRESQEEFDKLVNMVQIATESKLRARAPDTFAQFVQQVADETEGAVTEVYVDARTLVDVLAQSGVEQGAFIGQVPSVAEQLQDAVTAGEAVSIPVGEFMGNVVGTGLEAALLPHLRASETSLSQTELQEAGKLAGEYLQQMAEKVVTEVNDATAFQTSADVVKGKVLEQLNAGKRFTADVNETYATLIRNFYAVLSSRYKITPEQMWEGGWADASGKVQPARRLAVGAEGVPNFAPDVLQKNNTLKNIVGTDTAAEVQAATQSFEQVQPGANDPITTEQRSQAEQVLAPLAERANAAKPEFDALVTRINQLFGQEPKLAPIKSLKRAAEKLVMEAGGDVNLIRDMLRATIVVQKLSDVQRAIEQVQQNFEIVRIKNRFETPTESGYRDVLINVRMPDGTVGEIQVNLPQMLAAKAEGHKLYEMARVLPAGDPRRVQLEELQARLYAEAFDSATNASNSAASTGAPYENTLAESGNGLGPAALNATQEPSGNLATGMPSTSNNFAPSGISNITGTSDQSIADAETANQVVLQQSIDAVLEAQPAPAAATLDDFTPAALPELLSKQGWAVLTAEDPGAAKATPEANAIATANLRADLDAMGVDYIEVSGKYGDVQGAFIITGLTEQEALELGRKYGQESVLTRSGLLYGDGSIVPAVGMEVYDTAPEDFYTTVPTTGAFFSVVLDFNAGTGEAFAQGKPVRGLGKPKSAVKAAPVVALPDTLTTTTAIDIRNGEKGNLSITQVGEYFDRITGQRDPADPAEFQRALDTLVAEIQHQLAQEKSGLDWYEEDIALAFGETQKLIPELKDPGQRQLFSVIAGILSPQTTARDNWFIAAKAFRHFKQTGVVPGRNPETGSLWQGGTTSVNKEKALVFLNNMIQDIGEAATIEWLMGTHTVKELNAARKTWGNMGPGVDGKMTDTAMGVRAFGPKVGPFVMNINGIHDITVDMWATRTFNRYFGRMIGPDGKIVDAPTEPQRKVVKDLFNEAAKQLGIKGYQVQSVIWFFEQQLFNQLGTGAQSYGFSDGAFRFAGEIASDGGAVTGGPSAVGSAQASEVLAQSALDTGINLTGVHFSKAARTSLDGVFYGTGLKGLEAERLKEVTDSRLKNRVYFYVDEGKGIRPESGIGGIAHSADLTNLYDAKADPLRLWSGDVNTIESRILDAGFNGYYIRDAFNKQGAAVVLGNASKGIPAQQIANPTTGAPAQAAAPTQYRRGLLSYELNKLDLPAIQAVAPSANLRAGVFTVDEAELGAARGVLSKQGIALPGKFAQTLAEDMEGQAPFLEQRAKEAGYDTVDDWAANDVGAFMKAAEEWRQMNPAETLAQPKRGTFSPSQMRIELLKDADLSTFLHEAGHFFLDMMADLAAQPGAPEDINNDMAALLKWFGVPDLQTWQGYTLDQKRPYHEKFAESFEQYLFEGKAPNVELKPLFRRFREFMTSAYKSLKDFMARYNTGLSDEVRSVFDRMIATEDQINEAERVAGMLPDFDATNEAIEKLGARSLRDLKWVVNARSKLLKQLQKDVNEKRKAMKEEVTAEVRAMREYAVQRFLKFGELDGAKVEGGKLSLPVLKEIYGEGPAAPWRYLATNMVTKDAETGLHPNMVAELFGFTNGDEMTRAIIGAMPEDSTIDGMTDQRLLERYGDLVTEKGIERAANEAIHNEARARFVATELKAMQEAMNPRERTPAGGSVNVLLRAAKDFAENLVARRKVRDLKAGAHTSAEARAARRVSQAQSSGDTQAAITAKRDQLLNHYAARMTTEALTEIDKKVDYLRKFDKDSVRSKLPPEYLAQIDKLLERVELRRGTTLRELDKRAKLAEWITAQQELGLDPAIPDYLLEDVQLKSYKDMTVEEFRGLVDTVRNIEHLGRLKDKLLTLQDKRAFAAVVQELEASIRENATSSRPVRVNAPTKLDRATDAVRGFFSAHRKIASLIRQFDGMKDGGVFWGVFNRSMNAAGDKEAVMREQATKALSKIFEPIIKGEKLKTLAFIPAINMSLSLETRLAVALNWGNEANRQRVMDGDKWSSQQVDAILSTLTAEQLTFVQKAWDYINGYWPEIAAKEERVSGIAPEKVQASAFTVTLADGTEMQMRGGYYPIKYDPDRSSKAEADTAAELTKQMMMGQYTRATTRRGHTKGRADTVNRAVRKDIGVIFQHVDQVIHDLAWHEWLIDATRILRAGPIDAAIRETAGPEVLREMKKTIEDIAAGDVPAQSEFESAVNHLRVGTTIAGMGWNLMTSLMQPLGLTQSMVRIGPKWVGKGLARWIGDATRMENTVKEVYEKSDFMRLRGQTMQREIAEIRNKVQGEMAGPVKETFFYLIQKGQLIADLPTWLGQYEKAMADIVDEERAIALADQAVRDSQSGGQIMDLARVQRGGPLQKLFTNFYSYFNTTYQLTAERYNTTSFKDPLQVGRFMVDMLLLYTVPAVLGFAMKEALKGGGDDDDLAKRLAAEQLNYMLGTMVGLREVGAAVAGFNGYQGPAGTRFFSELGKFGKQVEQGDVDGALLKSLNNAAGILFHYPAGQVNRTVEGFNALVEGKTANPLVLAFGPPRE